MRRGFLNNPRKPATAQKTARVNKAASSSGEIALPDAQIYAIDEKYNNETSRYTIYTALTKQVTTKATMHPSSLICTRIPPSSIDDYGTSSAILYFHTQQQLSQNPKYLCTPSPYDLTSSAPYIIRDIESKGKGMFATRALKRGDLILVERPLLVLPVDNDLSAIEDCPKDIRSSARSPNGLLDSMLEVAFARMSEENKRSYLELMNSSPELPKLSGIWRTNAFAFKGLGEKRDQYGAVIKLMSRVNHSCRPNCITSFDKVSFSFELRATKPIAVGEEIVYAYCNMDAPTKYRQTRLKAYGFECTCASCIPETQNDALRTSLHPRLTSLIRCCIPFERDRGITDRNTALELYKENSALLRDLKNEGLDGWAWQMEAVENQMTLLSALERLSPEDTGGEWTEAYMASAKQVLRLFLAREGSNHPDVVKMFRDGVL